MGESKEKLTKPSVELVSFHYSNTGEARKPASKTHCGSQSVLSSCRICLSSLFDPARLVCGHRFCETCLDKYWKANEEPNFVVCPLCRDFAFKIGFVKKDARSTRDFRRKFDPDHIDIPPNLSKNVNFVRSNYLLKTWPIIMPLLYLVVTFIKPLILDALMKFNSK